MMAFLDGIDGAGSWQIRVNPSKSKWIKVNIARPGVSAGSFKERNGGGWLKPNPSESK
jgi:hypothetical protein